MSKENLAATQVTMMADLAQRCEPREQDAAALLIDAAAFLISSSNASPHEFVQRLLETHEMAQQAKAAIATHGFNAASRRQ